MKICVTSKGENLEAPVDSRFGRREYFIIVDSDSLEFEVIRNPHLDAMGGAGIQSGQLVAAEGVNVLLTGNIGPNAFQTLHAAGIEIICGVSGTVSEAIEKYKKGNFSPAQRPTTDTK